MQNWRETVNEIANDEIDGATRLRMLTSALVASNWVTLQMILLYVTDLLPARNAVRTSVFMAIVVLSFYFVLSRLPEIARKIQWIDQNRTKI